MNPYFSFASHQVPLPAARTDAGELAHLNRWLLSYSPSTIFSSEADSSSSLFSSSINSILPKSLERRLGFVSEAYADYKPLDLGDWKKFGYKKGDEVSAMKAIGKYLKDTVVRNPKTFRIFSPDELASNKVSSFSPPLQAAQPTVFDHVRCQSFSSTTSLMSLAEAWSGIPRLLAKEEESWRCSVNTPFKVIRASTLEVASYSSPFSFQLGWLQGYTLTGRSGIFPSYEAFLGIVGTMVVQ